MNYETVTQLNFYDKICHSFITLQKIISDSIKFHLSQRAFNELINDETENVHELQMIHYVS